MKKIILAGALALTTSAAFAEPTAILKVQGTLTNSACSVTLGNGGVIDYGYVRLGNLSATENNELGKKSIPVSITCDAPTKVGFTMQDNHSDSNRKISVPYDNGTSGAVIYFNYGIGQTSEGVNIGDYTIWQTNNIADGNAVDPIIQNHDWGTARWQKATMPRSDGFSTSTVAAVGSLEPIAISDYTFDLNINTMIADTTTLAITDDTPIEGQATMTLVYL